MVYIHKITSSIFKQPIHWHTFLEFFGRFHVNSSNGYDAKTLTGVEPWGWKWCWRLDILSTQWILKLWFWQKGWKIMTGESPRLFFSAIWWISKGFWLFSCFASRISHTSGELPQVSRWGGWGGAMEDPPEVWGFWMDGSVFGETLRFVGHTAYLKKGIYSSYLDPWSVTVQSSFINDGRGDFLGCKPLFLFTIHEMQAVDCQEQIIAGDLYEKNA